MARRPRRRRHPGRGGDRRHAERRAGGRRRDAYRDLRRHRRLVHRAGERPRHRRPPLRRPRARPPRPRPPRRPTRTCAARAISTRPSCGSRRACANHDRCYGAHQGKAACDTAFLQVSPLRDRHPVVRGQRELRASPRASCRAAAHLYYKGRGDRGRLLLMSTTQMTRRRVAHTAWRSSSTRTRRRILAAGVRGIASTKRTARTTTPRAVFASASSRRAIWSPSKASRPG